MEILIIFLIFCAAIVLFIRREDKKRKAMFDKIAAETKDRMNKAEQEHREFRVHNNLPLSSLAGGAGGQSRAFISYQNSSGDTTLPSVFLATTLVNSVTESTPSNDSFTGGGGEFGGGGSSGSWDSSSSYDSGSSGGGFDSGSSGGFGD